MDILRIPMINDPPCQIRAYLKTGDFHLSLRPENSVAEAKVSNTKSKI
jgi:hypothetical protein